MSVIIAIAGGSCSGKTTLARHLQRRLGMDEAMLIRQDDYYFDIRERAASGARDSGAGMPNFDVPEALDFALLADDLERLKSGQAVSLPNYDFTTHQRVSATQPLAAKRFTIVEGLLLLNDPIIREQADVRIYMRCSYALRLQRRLARDVAERDRSEAFVTRQFAQDVEPAHIKYIRPSKAHADIVIEQEDYVQSIDSVMERIIDAIPTDASAEFKPL